MVAKEPGSRGGNVCAGVGREESRRLSYYFFVAHFHMAKITQKEAEAIPQVRPRPCREQRHVPAVAGTAPAVATVHVGPDAGP